MSFLCKGKPSLFSRIIIVGFTWKHNLIKCLEEKWEIKKEVFLEGGACLPTCLHQISTLSSKKLQIFFLCKLKNSENVSSFQ
jgi:hypothetical protein